MVGRKGVGLCRICPDSSRTRTKTSRGDTTLPKYLNLDHMLDNCKTSPWLRIKKKQRYEEMALGNFIRYMFIYIHAHIHKCVYIKHVQNIYTCFIYIYTYALYTYMCVCICFINMYVYVFKIFKEMGIVTHIFNLSTQKQKQAGL